MCNNYFVRRLSDAHTIRYDNMANIFCSSICASHFMLKYRSIAACAFCVHPSYNFYMVTLISDRGTNERYFCSKSCLELFVELENAVLVDVGQEADQDVRDFMSMMRRDTDRFVQLPGKRVSVATQTDFVYDHNNNNDVNNNNNNNNDINNNNHRDKENQPRVILTARKRTVHGKVLQVQVHAKANTADVKQAIIHEID